MNKEQNKLKNLTFYTIKFKNTLNNNKLDKIAEKNKK